MWQDLLWLVRSFKLQMPGLKVRQYQAADGSVRLLRTGWADCGTFERVPESLRE